MPAVAAKNNGIGVGGSLPWRLPKEMAYFSRVTTTVADDEKIPHDDGRPTVNACIMGRRTWEELPPRFRPLAGRYNIVITRNRDLLDGAPAPLTTTQPSVADALAHIDEVSRTGDVRIARVFIVGGTRVYDEALHMSAHHVQVLMTRVEFADADKCDTFFPVLDASEYILQPHSRLEEVVGFEAPRGMQTEAGTGYQFLLYERRSNAADGTAAS
ncbi:dihydrofolate reductase [Coemansia biformis]|uniref:Dihydrofolate reductase n=1 Tax=Coemansia biformis TaxID=1286918 RepID=A0A9W7YC55_9FUNG|nr:dihydrofolate reductase [Coemansia biformis]